MFNDVLVVNQNNVPLQMECRAVIGQYLQFLQSREKFIMAAKEDVGPTLPAIFSSVWKTYEYTETTDDGSGTDIYQVQLYSDLKTKLLCFNENVALNLKNFHAFPSCLTSLSFIQ